MAETSAVGTVKIGGDTKGLVIAYKKADEASAKLNISLGQTQQAWDKQAQAAKRAETATFIATARMENARQRAAELDATFGKAGTQFDRSTAAIGRTTVGLNKLEPAMRFAAGATASGQASVVGFVNALLSATTALGPYGMAVGAAGAVLVGLAKNQYDAAEAAKVHAEELKKQKREMDDVARADRARRVVERVAAEGAADKAFKLEQATTPIREDMRDLEKQIAVNRSMGVDTKLLEIRLLEEEAKLIRQTGSYEESLAVEHQAELMRLTAMNGEHEKITGQMKKQLEIIEQRRRIDPRMMADVDSQIVAGGLQADESSASRFGGTVIDPFSHDNEMQIAMDVMEEKRRAQHEAEKQRLKEIKDAEDERIDSINQSAKIGQEAASIAVAGILDISDARRDAIRVAKLQGATEREAQQAGKIATAIALESQLKSLRNMAAMHAIEYTAKGIASQASTYGFPNPQSVGYFTAAGVFATLAVGAGVGAFAAGQHADSLRGGGGGGFGAGFGPGSGGAANGPRGGSANTGPSPVDSSVPGSPTPQPRSGNAPMGSTTVIQIDRVYGTIDKDFIRKVDFGLGELGHERKRNS